MAAFLTLPACAHDARGRRFTVHVENEEGLPLAGARVEADVTHDALTFGRFEGCVGTELARGETGRDGTFRFTASTRGMTRSRCSGATIHVTYLDWPDHHSSYSPEAGAFDQASLRPPLAAPAPTEPDGSITIRARIGPAATARGAVRWREQPGCEEVPRVVAVEGFDVAAGSPFPTGTTVVRSETRVDASGAFALGGLGTGQVTIIARQCGRVARRELPRGATDATLLDADARRGP